MLFFTGLMLFAVCTCLLFFIGASERDIYDRFDQAYILCLAFGAFTGFVCCVVDLIVQNIMMSVG